MDVTSIIISTAKALHISGTLLLAICQHESLNFTINFSENDHGSPSYGVCQLKEATARQMGFKGKTKELMNPWVNSKYAALYLKYKQKRYGDNWVQVTASYNAGSYHPSSIVPGCPRNLKYVKLVQKKLPPKLQARLSCGEVAKK